MKLSSQVELALAKAQKEDSVFRIGNAEDGYNILTDGRNLGESAATKFEGRT
jgi:hypothetical protein